MKNAVPLLIIGFILILAIWFLFAKVIPNIKDKQKLNQSKKKEASLTNYEAAATVDFIHSLPKF